VSRNGGKTAKPFDPDIGKETQFKKGNPGRPKGARNRSTIARKWLEATTKGEDLDGNELDLTYEDLITLAQIKKAKDSGDTAAYNALVDSAFGKAKQSVEVEDKTPQPFRVFEINE